MRIYKYYTCDVFTNKRFGGNPLAVIIDAQGLTTEEMQKIAREFNYSESTFVLPPENKGNKKVRIFTPSVEVPFAGHPNVGTAATLATIGGLGNITNDTIVFEEKAGDVPIGLCKNDEGLFRCELKAPERLSIGQTVSPEEVAEALSLSVDDIVTTTHEPQEASVGLQFLMVELKDLSALQRAKVNPVVTDNIRDRGITPDIHVYIRSNDEYDLRTRMFAPNDGVFEDPATGSANVALTSMLVHYNSELSKEYTFTIAQGVEMGRPSVLYSRALKKDGIVTDAWIGGTAVMVSSGEIYID